MKKALWMVLLPAVALVSVDFQPATSLEGSGTGRPNAEEQESTTTTNTNTNTAVLQ